METFIKGFVRENKREIMYNLFSIYFYLEISNKPLKAYLGIIKMKNQRNDILTEAELAVVTEEAREEFDKIFFIHKIENDSIPMLKVVEFESILKDVEAKILQAAEKMMEFYEIFFLKTVKVH